MGEARGGNSEGQATARDVRDERKDRNGRKRHAADTHERGRQRAAMNTAGGSRLHRGSVLAVSAGGTPLCGPCALVLH